MKQFLYASLLALCLTAAAGQEASANGLGNCTFSFGISWSCWRDFCFPCVDPSLFGLSNGCGYGGGYAGYGQPVYQAAPVYLNAPAGSAAPATSSYMQPTWNYPGYQNAGYYYPQSGFSTTPGTWYGYGY